MMYFPNENSINLQVGLKDKIYVYSEVLPSRCLHCDGSIIKDVTYKINGSSIAHRCDECGAIHMEYYPWLYMPNRDSYNVINLQFAEEVRGEILCEQRISRKLEETENRILSTRRKMKRAEERKKREAIRDEIETVKAIKARNGEPLGKMPKQRKRSIYS